MPRYSDHEVATELLHNDERLQKRVKWFYRSCRKDIRKYVLQNDGHSKDADQVVENSFVALFHDLKHNGMPAKSLSDRLLEIAKILWDQRHLSEKERQLSYPRLHEEKGMEKLFARMDDSEVKVLKAFYYEMKEPAEISHQFGKPFEIVEEQHKWPALEKLKNLLVKDEDLLHELQSLLADEV